MASRSDLARLRAENKAAAQTSPSISDKIKEQLPFLSKVGKRKSDPDKTDPGFSADDDDDVKPAKGGKKSASKIIYPIVAIGLLVVFAEDILPPGILPGTDPVAPPVVERIPKEAPAPVAEAAQAPATTDVTEVPTEAGATSPTEAPVETPAVTEPTVTDPAVEEAPAVVSEEPGVTPAQQNTVTLSEAEPVITEEKSIPLPEMPLNESTLSGPDDVSGAISENISEDEIGSPESNSTQKGDLTDKILLDLEKQATEKDKNAPKNHEYVSPPEYEYMGKGLVYNCIGKHWACVDAPSYKACEQNYDGNKALKKKAECYPFNVYDRPKTCQSSQLMMTSSNAKTGFCSE